MRMRRALPSRHPPPPLLGAGGRRGAQGGGSCHSRTRTHAGGMQTAGLPCGHVSAPPTEVGAQVPSLWALGARQAADERRCRLTLSWPHPSLLPPAAGWSLMAARGQRLGRRLGWQANKGAASAWGRRRASPHSPQPLWF